jgi:hypothetical protein
MRELSSERLGEDPELRVDSKGRTGWRKGSLGPRRHFFRAMPEISDYGGEPLLPGPVSDFE